MVLSLAFPPRSHNIPWQAKSSCLEYHWPAIERKVNKLPPVRLLPPESGETLTA
jgi:hypothetical protein